jgi:site-specific DNA recombinase
MVTSPQGGPLRASLYIRRSKASIDGETVSLDFQEHELRTMMARHGAEVVQIFKDDGRSGNNLKRQAWLDWIASSADVDIIGTWAIDRSARGNAVMSLYPIMTALAAYRVRLLTVRDRLDSDDPRFERDVLWEAQRANEDWKTISARNKATRDAKKRKGEWVGLPPFGTQIVDKVLVVNEEEAAIVREAASRLLRGDAIAATTRWLNSTGARTRRGNEWARNSLVANLTSDAARDLILDLSTYKAVQDVIHPRKGGGNGRTGGRPPAGLLSGLALCGSCFGKVYLYRYNDAPRATSAVYRCSTRAKGKNCETPGRISVEQADAEVERQYLDPEHADAIWWHETVEIVGGTMDEAQRALEAAEKALMAEKTMDNFLAAQEAEEAVKNATPGERRRTLIPLGTYGERWRLAGDDLATRRSLLASATEQILIGRGTVWIDWTHEHDPRTNE